MTSKLQTLGDSGPQYFCNFCLYGTNDKTEYIDHLHDEEHLTTVKESHKRESVYSCKSCNYITYNKNNYDKHLLSNKHKQLISNHNPQKKMICEFCNIEYSTRQSLWVHKKKCNKQKQTKDNLAPHLLSVGVTPNTPNASASNNASALFNSGRFTTLISVGKYCCLKKTSGGIISNEGSYPGCPHLSIPHD